MQDRHRNKPFPLRMEEDLRMWIRRKSCDESRSQNGSIIHILREAMHREQQNAQK